MTRLAAILATALLVSAAACGGDEAATPGEAEETTTEETTVEETTTEAVDEACADQLGPFLTELSGLDSRLNVGLSFERYSTLVSDTSVTYDQIPFDELGPECSNRVGVPAERAFNAYVRAYNVWNDCITDVDCTQDELDSRVPPQWARAETLIQRAEQNLEQLSGS